MSTRSTVSERFLAEVICRRLSGKGAARVLIGGLGFGYTLREMLDRTNALVQVEVVELLPEVIDWNRRYLADFNGSVLENKRVTVHCDDVWKVLAGAGSNTYDAILMDVDNGAMPLVQSQNRRLYGMRGLYRVALVLVERGYVAYWSASPDFSFSRRLAKAGFLVEEIPVRAHERARRSAHVVYLARATGTKSAP